MLRTIRRPTVLFASTLCMGLALITAASSTAQASKSCKSILLDGGVLSGLTISGAGCTTARQVQNAHNACIVRPRGRGLRPCDPKFLNSVLRSYKLPSYRCRESNRQQTTRSATGQVTCTRFKKTVRYSYDLPSGRKKG